MSFNTRFNCSLRFWKLRKASRGNHLYFMNLHNISILFSSGEYGGRKKIYKSCFFQWLILDLNNLLLCMGALSKTITVLLVIILQKSSRYLTSSIVLILPSVMWYWIAESIVINPNTVNLFDFRQGRSIWLSFCCHA